MTIRQIGLKLAALVALLGACTFAIPEAQAGGSFGITLHGGGPYGGYSIGYYDRGYRGYGPGYYGYSPYYRPIYRPIYRPVYRSYYRPARYAYRHRAPWCDYHGVYHFHSRHGHYDRYYDDRYYYDGYRRW